ncbi:MAG: cyclic nucleotide-binding domain-containing protein [Actinomycetota bacterium]
MDRMVPAGAFASVMAARPRGRRPIPAPEIDLLAEVPLFAGLSKRQLKRVAEAADEVIYRERAIVFLEGDTATHLFVVAEGTARVFRGFVPSSRTLRRYGPGEIFGELGALTNSPRGASVAAETPLTCVRISRTNLDRLLKKEPDIAVRMLYATARFAAELASEAAAH